MCGGKFFFFSRVSICLLSTVNEWHQMKCTQGYFCHNCSNTFFASEVGSQHHNQNYSNTRGRGDWVWSRTPHRLDSLTHPFLCQRSQRSRRVRLSKTYSYREVKSHLQQLLLIIMSQVTIVSIQDIHLVFFMSHIIVGWCRGITRHILPELPVIRVTSYHLN